VVGVTGTRVLLADQQGRVTTAALPVLAAAADFALVDRHEPAGLPPLGTLEGLAPEAVEAARWWERHILEVLHGHDPQAAPGLAPRPEYEPSRHSLSQRERAKAARLTAAGHQVSASTVKHRRQRYQSQGMVGLVDHRIDKKISVFGRSDPRGQGDAHRDRGGQRFLRCGQQLHSPEVPSQRPPTVTSGRTLILQPGYCGDRPLSSAVRDHTGSRAPRCPNQWCGFRRFSIAR
jgi:hypothetical protein